MHRLSCAARTEARVTTAISEILAATFPSDKPPRLPGFLLAPFGWAAESVAAMIAAEHAFLADLFYLGCRRMHLVALAIAHSDGGAQRLPAQLLLRGSIGEILDAVFGRRPAGLVGALNRMPPRALARESYRRLIALLDDPACGRALAYAGDIDDAKLLTFAETPAQLRPVV